MRIRNLRINEIQDIASKIWSQGSAEMFGRAVLYNGKPYTCILEFKKKTGLTVVKDKDGKLHVVPKDYKDMVRVYNDYNRPINIYSVGKNGVFSLFKTDTIFITCENFEDFYKKIKSGVKVIYLHTPTSGNKYTTNHTFSEKRLRGIYLRTLKRESQCTS